MYESISKVAVAALIALGASQPALAQTLRGATGSGTGTGWQASWIDLKPGASFKKGDILRIKVEGSAENLLVRLLPVTSQPSSSDGIEGGVRKVPANRMIDVKLERDHPNIKQISLHAGPEAWGRPLGPNNASVRLVSVERVDK